MQRGPIQLLRFLLALLGCSSTLIAAPTPPVQPQAHATAPGPDQPWVAQWIWARDGDVHAYNQAILARKTVRLEPVRRATLRITADSWYRLWINGTWVNDGPCRSWPNHYQYDVLDVTPYLQPGPNEIRVLARYFGVGDFHRIPQQAGLLAQLDLQTASGRTLTLGTDRSWEVALFPALLPRTPKISIQMGPCEWFDAREAEPLRFRPARVLFPATGGPWQDLRPRDVALLTRTPAAFKTLLHARTVRAEGWNFCVPAARLVNPGLIEANHHTSCGFGMATLLEVRQPTRARIRNEGMKLSLNGRPVEGDLELAPGQHLLLGFPRRLFGHDKEKAVRFLEPEGYQLVNPLDPRAPNPWVFIELPEFAHATNDLLWVQFSDLDPHLARLARSYEEQTDRWLQTVTNIPRLRETLGTRCKTLPPETMFVEDIFWRFPSRQILEDTPVTLEHPAAMLHDNAETTVIHPGPRGDVELLLDLGEQRVGYWTFDLQADPGVIVDMAAVEYIAPDGRIQWSWGNRNALRYITRAGRNQYTSVQRRSGRYVFLTLRNFHNPVRIRYAGIVEATYPVEYRGAFRCSDARLTEIWNISARTLKLCMEDTFTDCPLYEQTHWVGDARNEALFAYGIFGAHDLARRCIRLTAESLERFPIAGCQTPSSWDVLIPAWSFLWGIAAWDYYWETGDRDWLRQTYPAMIRNLQGAARFLNNQDLFSAPFWNFFDWVNLDQNRQTVLHNSLLMAGAIDAALRTADVLGDSTHTPELHQWRNRLTRGIQRLWLPQRGAYADALHDDGSLSPVISQHTSFLALLFDVVPPEQRAAAIRNLTNPPPDMVLVGSPFAALYLYEALEKLGLQDLILAEIYRHYLPMLEAGATTAWESFPTGTTGGGRFPTRSHCHAWSSAPVYYLNRLILGIQPAAPGASEVIISPRLFDLTWAEGRTATIRGPVEVSWRRDASTLTVHYTVPPGVKATFQPNPSHAGLKIIVNGREWSGADTGR
ncbi:hypothetical protein G4L39_12465 [Limisphaera ngatamarikiensis]|uniref:Alpha-L-rhamnosidase n=1 Tax=Limisphaera ngatamarikiensis TaxID=1324935 RepID=A0A6M1S4I5_9BACT|nr:alpha-L-rhamnosidase C-terminal domain-containing protein [Limisphaera ngatamarikiensis]NGO40200.1 hypothetical protein [Limisphaera ngatamarikiensis]